MKRIGIGVLTGCLALAMATGALAEQKEQVNVYENNNLVKSVVFIEGRSEYFVDGNTPGVKMDAAPYISQDRTFVPVRFLGNALGVTNENIFWDTETSKAKLVLGSRSAELTIGKKELLAGSQAKTMDVAPELKNARTYLPARFVAEALGYQVDFVDGLVVCYPEGTEKPDVKAVKQYLQEPQQQGETYNLNGYTVPKDLKTGITISDSKINSVEIKLGIIIPKEDVQAQCDEAEQILASKLGNEFAKKVVDVARTKTTQLVQIGEHFTGPNGEHVMVQSSWGGVTTSIVIWGKEGNN
ncbi:copper amine oxidase N-terminal domain-containing protein [Desulforamulus ruminis]|uniref:copper amine oxidase N-terminal domain-containing protein n=1 Tax=Desulforamulus ruminis TaxID=1564 RepID=UPI002355FCE3|nr:copper amine oxidase N-terminal domain-containing protein [Desulforamulus ruminis]